MTFLIHDFYSSVYSSVSAEKLRVNGHAIGFNSGFLTNNLQLWPYNLNHRSTTGHVRWKKTYVSHTSWWEWACEPYGWNHSHLWISNWWASSAMDQIRGVFWCFFFSFPSFPWQLDRSKRAILDTDLLICLPKRLIWSIMTVSGRIVDGLCRVNDIKSKTRGRKAHSNSLFRAVNCSERFRSQKSKKNNKTYYT